MKKAILLMLTLMLGLAACNKQGDLILIPPPLYGLYTETSPVNGRSQLYFTDSNVVIRTETGSTVEDAYYYKFVGHKIRLAPVVDTTLYTDLYFNLISSSKFQIQDIYPSIPEDPASMMVFEK